MPRQHLPKAVPLPAPSISAHASLCCCSPAPCCSCATLRTLCALRSCGSWCASGRLHSLTVCYPDHEDGQCHSARLRQKVGSRQARGRRPLRVAPIPALRPLLTQPAPLWNPEPVGTKGVPPSLRSGVLHACGASNKGLHQAQRQPPAGPLSSSRAVGTAGGGMITCLHASMLNHPRNSAFPDLLRKGLQNRAVSGLSSNDEKRF